MSLAWLLVAAALLLSGGHRTARGIDRRATGGRGTERRATGGCGTERRGIGRRQPERSERRALSPRVLALLAGAATSCCCVALLGVGRGLIPALLALPLTAAAVRRLHARPGRVRVEPALPLALDLLAVALRAGQPLERALLAAAPAAGTLGVDLVRIGRLLQLGAEPADAWRATPRQLEPVAAVGTRSATSGIRLAAGFDTLADDLRAQLRHAGAVRAHRAGVLAAAPLGLCFLPAFVCIGIVPALIGLATHLMV